MKVGIRIVAWAHIVLGALGLIVCLGLIWAFLAQTDPVYAKTVGFIVPVCLSMSAVWFGPGLAGGIGLLWGQRWARTFIWVLSALWAPLFPVGTALGGFGVYVLLKDGPAGGDVAPGWAKPSLTREQRKRFSGLLLAAVAALGILGGILWIGWLMRDAIDPPKRQVIRPFDGSPPALDDARPRYTP